MAAAALGHALASGGHSVIYGGAAKGLMGELADSAMRAGGRVVGVIPRFLVDAEVAHRSLSELVVVESLHERKQRMAEGSDGFIALPGGFGTFEELCETITWAQLGLHRKPIVLVNVNGFFDRFAILVDDLVSHGFLRAEQRRMFAVAADAAEAVALLSTFTPPPAIAKWLPAPGRA